jgi:chromosome segregation ATPase
MESETARPNLELPENPYEAKFLTEFARVKTRLDNLRDELSSLLESRNKTLNDYKAMGEAQKLVSAHVAELMGPSVGALQEEIQRLESKISFTNSDITRYMNTLDHLVDLCPHVNTEYDHTDYHKREDYHECKVCGTIL